MLYSINLFIDCLLKLIERNYVTLIIKIHYRHRNRGYSNNSTDLKTRVLRFRSNSLYLRVGLEYDSKILGQIQDIQFIILVY